MKRIWAFILVAVLLCPALAAAAEVDLSGAPVIRRPLEWRKGRFALSPVIGVTVADPYWTTMLIGASVDYHILDWLAVGADFRYGVGFTTGLLDRIEGEITAAKAADLKAVDPAAPTPTETEGEADVLTVERLDWLVTANVQLIPVYGKFTLFDTLEMAYDLHFFAGVGYAATKRFPEDSKVRQGAASGGGVAPMFGLGVRIFVIRWFAVNIEFRDYMVEMVRAVPRYSGGGKVPGAEFEHNLSLSMGFTFLFPTEIDNAEE